MRNARRGMNADYVILTFDCEDGDSLAILPILPQDESGRMARIPKTGGYCEQVIAHRREVKLSFPPPCKAPAARDHSRFCGFMKAERQTAYFGVPVALSDGRRAAALAATCMAPCAWSANDVQVLKRVAAQIEALKIEMAWFEIASS